MELNSSTSLPLFRQVEQRIKSDIDSCVYNPGYPIPSERELSEKYGISRVTVRHAIEDLVDRGILVRKQGKGTFVRAHSLERQITQSAECFTFVQMCEAVGKKPGTQGISVDTVKGRPEVLGFLGLPAGSRLLRAQRIRTADGTPIMLENSLFPMEGFDFIREGVFENPSIFGLVKQETGRSAVGHARRTLRVDSADQDMSRKLRVPVGEPLFLETVSFTDSADKPLFVGEDYFVGHLMVFDF